MTPTGPKFRRPSAIPGGLARGRGGEWRGEPHREVCDPAASEAEKAARRNVLRSVRGILEQSQALDRLAAEGRIVVAGAMYDCGVRPAKSRRRRVATVPHPARFTASLPAGRATASPAAAGRPARGRS